MATKTPAKAKQAPAKKADPVVELTPVDEGVQIEINDGRAELEIKGTFDLDGLMAVNKRVARARAALS